ncbi:13069_t:CDS:2 [Ambispora gerdemannii]|uniref:13069_t:CDS:1 n=1 Tax=Ambispora gerdemannii TaxID=144530 RepID=A0A9N9FAA5_9GLOM|nr:13069_t:CDS:2 [Ambispora gerdemannii]
MSKSFGPIFKVHLGQLTWIVINDHKIAKDLFVSRGATFSSRVVFGLTDILTHDSKSVGLAPNSSWWKTMRTLELQAIRPHIIDNMYFPIICDNMKIFLQQLHLKSLGNNIAQSPTADIRFSITKILTTIIFGELANDSAILERYDYLIKKFFEFGDIKGSLLSVFGWLKYFGLQKIFEREARQLEAEMNEFANGLLQQIKNRIIENGPDSETCVSAETLKSVTVDPAFVASPHTHEFEKDENGKYIFDNYDVLTICSDLMIAGVPTTSGALDWIFATLANYPKVQRKIQQELDRVVGKGKFYTMDHNADLHYLKATIKESLRFRTVVNLSPPHCSSQDEIYNGYHIPANTGIVINFNAIHSNPLLHDEPHEFRPERYLDDDGHLKQYDEFLDPWVIIRNNLAYCNMLTFIGHTLAVFDFELEKDLFTNEPIKINLDAGKGHDFDYRPPEYKLIFKVREGVDIETTLTS